MYEVSDAFKTAIKNKSRTYYWSGVVTTKSGTAYNFTSEDIVKGSGSITNSCCGSTEIEIGSVYAAELSISLLMDIDRYELDGGTITLSFHLLLADGSYEEVPMGIFVISEANRKVKCISIKAYDYMLKFEKTYSDIQTTGKPYDLLQLACRTCGVSLAHTEAEISAMCNGTLEVSVYEENDIETWRDFVYYTAQVLGGYATINRDGELEIRHYRTEADWEVADTQRFSSSFSDFVTRYTAVSSTNVITNTAEYYALETDDALTMNLGINPLLQYGTSSIREKAVENILDEISKIEYVPFDSDTIGNPAMDVGDVLSFTGRNADSSKLSCITSVTYRINSKHTLKCVGEDPTLASAKSRNDKNISGLLSSVNSSQIQYYAYQNADAVDVGDGKEEMVIIIKFATASSRASIEIKMEMLLNALFSSGEDSMTVSVRYLLNDIEENYYPVETYAIEGDHVLGLHYYIGSLDPGERYTWKVFITATGGSLKADIGEIRALIIGQGLAAEYGWDGFIVLEDEVAAYAFADFALFGMGDSATVTLRDPLTAEATDEVSVVDLTPFRLTTTEDSCLVILERLKYTVITEDGDSLLMESGDTFITEGGQT